MTRYLNLWSFRVHGHSISHCLQVLEHIKRVHPNICQSESFFQYPTVNWHFYLRHLAQWHKVYVSRQSRTSEYIPSRILYLTKHGERGKLDQTAFHPESQRCAFGYEALPFYGVWAVCV